MLFHKRRNPLSSSMTAKKIIVVDLVRSPEQFSIICPVKVAQSLVSRPWVLYSQPASSTKLYAYRDFIAILLDNKLKLFPSTEADIYTFQRVGSIGKLVDDAFLVSASPPMCDSISYVCISESIGHSIGTISMRSS